MYEVSRKGEWLPWISFFLEAVSESALGTILVVERLQALQMRYRERFQKAGQSALLPRIIDLAFEQPALTVPYIAQPNGVTDQARSEEGRQGEECVRTCRCRWAGGREKKK